MATRGSAGEPLHARWSSQDGRAVQEAWQAVASTPETRTEFHVAHPYGWPTGRYRLELLHNGSVVETKEFEVRR